MRPHNKVKKGEKENEAIRNKPYLGGENPKMHQTTRRDIFYGIIHAAYCGESYSYSDNSYDLKPRLVEPRDFYRKIERPSDTFEQLMTELDPAFKTAAKNEMYRSEKGWIDQGIQQNKIRRISFPMEEDAGKKERMFLIPVLSPQPTVGIDSSGIVDNEYLYAFCFFEDAIAGYTYLEKHIGIRKSHSPSEFKYGKLELRDEILIQKYLSILLKISCRAVLLLDTDILNMKKLKKIDKPRNIFTMILDGCFTGGRPERTVWRNKFRKKLYNFANSVKIHCDDDFGLTPQKVVNKFIRTLSNNGEFGVPEPIYVILESHESKPIQVADIIVGACRRFFQQTGSPHSSFSDLCFDDKKLARLFKRKKAKKIQKGSYVAAHYWISQKINID